MEGLAAVETVHYGTEDEGNAGVEQFGRDEDTEGGQNSFSDFGFVGWPDIGCEGLQHSQHETINITTRSPHFHHLQPADFPLPWKSNLVPGQSGDPGVETGPAPLESCFLTVSQ